MFNPFLPGNLHKGHRQTVQILIRCHTGQGLHCLLTGFSIKNRINVTYPAIAAMHGCTVFSILVTVGFIHRNNVVT